MQEIGSYEARVHFSDLLRRVEKGEEFLVTVRGTPVASLTSIKREHRPKDLSTVIDELRVLRQAVAKRGPLLRPGETWTELARENLKW